MMDGTELIEPYWDKAGGGANQTVQRQKSQGGKEVVCSFQREAEMAHDTMKEEIER